MPRLSPDELRAWRDQFGCSQQRLADLLEVAEMTISRWERGVRETPPYLYLALRSLEDQP